MPNSDSMSCCSKSKGEASSDQEGPDLKMGLGGVPREVEGVELEEEAGDDTEEALASPACKVTSLSWKPFGAVS